MWLNSSVATKKGKRAGTTEVAHKISPFLAEAKLVLEKRIKPIQNKQKRRDSAFF